MNIILDSTICREKKPNPTNVCPLNGIFREHLCFAVQGTDPLNSKLCCIWDMHTDYCLLTRPQVCFLFHFLNRAHIIT